MYLDNFLNQDWVRFQSTEYPSESWIWLVVIQNTQFKQNDPRVSVTPPLPEDQVRKIAGTQVATERSIIKITRSDRTRNVDVKEKTGAKDCRFLAKTLKMDYADHLARRGRIGRKEQ